MKTIKTILVTALLSISIFSSHAQTADEIINKYVEKIGGADKFNALNGIKMELSLNYQSMKLPVEIVQLKEGKTYIKFSVQGTEIVQLAFDGTTAWSTNQMTLKAEKMTPEKVENLKIDRADFPDAFVNYKTKGYKYESKTNSKL